MIGKTTDDIRPPVPMRPEDDPLEAGNKYTPHVRPGPRPVRPANHVSETYRRTRERSPEEWVN